MASDMISANLCKEVLFLFLFPGMWMMQRETMAFRDYNLVLRMLTAMRWVFSGEREETYLLYERLSSSYAYSHMLRDIVFTF